MTIRLPIRCSISIFIASVAAATCFSGCATIVGGGRDQAVHIDSEPQGARVLVDGQTQGVTPTDVTLSRRQEHQVQLDMAGYQSCVTALKPGCNPWIFGNLLCGGLVGVAVDASTGAMSTLYPTEVKTVFAQTPASIGTPPAGSRFPVPVP
jgi:hypothetical protein